MQTKLTLRLDADVIRRAKAYARRRGKSVSTVVADYFATLRAAEGGATELTPTARALLGALGPAGADEAAYRQYLEKKHR